eukprot:572018-Alexandrium_andersonii.AAC.1
MERGMSALEHEFAIKRPRAPSTPACVGRLGICANRRAACTPREPRGPIVRFLGAYSSSSEFLRWFCSFGREVGYVLSVRGASDYGPPIYGRDARDG